MSDNLFGLPPAAPAVKESNTQRITRRKKEMLAAGVHPVSGAKLADNGKTCGNCAFHFVHTHGKRYHKCEYNATGGELTDIRVSWPACELFQEAPK